MPPKSKVPIETPSVIGAKIATVSIGPLDSAFTTTGPQLAQKVNLNCPLDIVLDFIRRQLNSSIDLILREILAIQEGGTSSAVASEESVLIEKEKNNDLQKRLVKIRSQLGENIQSLELFEGTTPMLCQQVSSPPPPLPPFLSPVVTFLSENEVACCGGFDPWRPLLLGLSLHHRNRADDLCTLLARQ
jgi:hypothetical protein